MESATPSTSRDDKLCEICNDITHRYVCPKCSLRYCSAECYKSTAHSECSELFFKSCVDEELRLRRCDPEMRRDTLTMLQRLRDEEVQRDALNGFLLEDEDDNDEVELDSDDDNVPSLENRLKNINLDNADELWSALTESERQEFEALIENGEASKLLPPWDPWWNYSLPKKLITEVDSDKNPMEKTYENNCPKILNVAALKSIHKVSPFIRFSIINTIYAYAYSVLHFNGEHQSTPLDTINVFLQICDTILVNRVFKDCSSAIENVLLKITNCEALSGDQETILETKTAGDAILNGPEEANKSFYALAALSDLHELLRNVKKTISVKKSDSNNSDTFKNKFVSDNLAVPKLSKTNVSLFLKKIEFYIAWLKSKSKTYDITEGEKV